MRNYIFGHTATLNRMIANKNRIVGKDRSNNSSETIFNDNKIADKESFIIEAEYSFSKAIESNDIVQYHKTCRLLLEYYIRKESNPDNIKKIRSFVNDLIKKAPFNKDEYTEFYISSLKKSYENFYTKLSENFSNEKTKMDLLFTTIKDIKTVEEWLHSKEVADFEQIAKFLDNSYRLSGTSSFSKNVSLAAHSPILQIGKMCFDNYANLKEYVDPWKLYITAMTDKFYENDTEKTLD